MNARVILLFALLVLTGCASLPGYRRCAEVRLDDLARLPKTLSDTGLFADPQNERLGPGVVAYRPQFELWSDGASKRRWIFVPEGARIDSTDMDAWLFPPGTKLWKEFTRDGVRVETRLLYKY